MFWSMPKTSPKHEQDHFNVVMKTINAIPIPTTILTGTGAKGT
jgi:hypothetical protein